MKKAHILAILLTQFFADASTDDSVIDEAVTQLFAQCIEIIVELRQTGNNFLELESQVLYACATIG